MMKKTYLERFEELELELEENEEYRQHPEILYWFVSNYGRCISVYRKVAHLLRPFIKKNGRRSKDGKYFNNSFYYKKPKQGDVKVQHLVAEVFPDQIISFIPEGYSGKLHLHHIKPYNVELGCYVNNRADNLQWLPPKYHFRVTNFKHGKTLVAPEVEELKTEKSAIIEKSQLLDKMGKITVTSEGRKMERLSKEEEFLAVVALIRYYYGNNIRIVEAHDKENPSQQFFLVMSLEAEEEN